MSKELKHIEISEIRGLSELVQLAEEVQATKQSKVLTRNGEELVVIQPTNPEPKKRARGQGLTRDDALWRLVGSASSAEPTDASKKHEYLVQENP